MSARSTGVDYTVLFTTSSEETVVSSSEPLAIPNGRTGRLTTEGNEDVEDETRHVRAGMMTSPQPWLASSPGNEGPQQIEGGDMDVDTATRPPPTYTPTTQPPPPTGSTTSTSTAVVAGVVCGAVVVVVVVAVVVCLICKRRGKLCYAPRKVNRHEDRVSHYAVTLPRDHKNESTKDKLSPINAKLSQTQTSREVTQTPSPSSPTSLGSQGNNYFHRGLETIKILETMDNCAQQTSKNADEQEKDQPEKDEMETQKDKLCDPTLNYVMDRESVGPVLMNSSETISTTKGHSALESHDTFQH